MRHATLLVVVPAVTLFTNLHAQDSPPVAVGTRVRVTAPTLDLDKYDGTLRAFGGDTLVLERQQRERRGALMVDTLRVALTQVTRLDVHRGTKGNAGKGALIGGSVLGAAGLGLSILFVAGGCEFVDSSGCDGSGPAVIAIGTAITFGAGALLGAVTGAFIKSDRWEEVPVYQPRVSFAPQRDGRFSLGLSVAF